jgi:hypothetical protein
MNPLLNTIFSKICIKINFGFMDNFQVGRYDNC